MRRRPAAGQKTVQRIAYSAQCVHIGRCVSALYASYKDALIFFKINNNGK